MTEPASAGPEPADAAPGVAEPADAAPSAKPAQPVLSAQDLTVRFNAPGGRTAHAADRVNLDVRPGEIIALAGESGCGKTTVARTLLGLEKPTGGQVTFRGQPLGYGTKELKSYRREAQLVLQDPTGALNPRHTVYDAVAEGLRIHGIQDDETGRVADALSRAGLRPPEKFFLTYPHELSGGQRQRVVIAGALVLQPSLIIADEPVASLDASVRGEILALLLGLRDDLGLSAVVVTHDLGLAWNIADRIAVMYLGRIVEIGSVDEILTDPQHPYTRALVSVLPDSPLGEPQILSGEPPDATDVPGGCRFHPRCPALSGGDAEAAGVANDCRHTPLPVLPLGEAGTACHLVAARQGAPHVSAAVS